MCNVQIPGTPVRRPRDVVFLNPSIYEPSRVYDSNPESPTYNEGDLVPGAGYTQRTQFVSRDLDVGTYSQTLSTGSSSQVTLPSGDIDLEAFGGTGDQPPGIAVNGEGWYALDNLLNALEAEGDAWAEFGTAPGNPRIARCYVAGGSSPNNNDSDVPWCTFWLTWVLYRCNIDAIRSGYSQAYLNYGQNIPWQDGFRQVRKNDILVYSNVSGGGGHVGFFRGYDPQTGFVHILGGNQGNRVKLTTRWFGATTSDGKKRLNVVRRNWAVPAEFDRPLFVGG